MSKNKEKMVMVRKRSKELVDFDGSRIITAISKANKEVPFEEKASLQLMQRIAKEIEEEAGEIIDIEEIQDKVEDKLLSNNKHLLGKRYIIYRDERMKEREGNTTDKPVMELLELSNKEVEEENSNKDSRILSTQRDQTAGLISKDIADRLILPKSVVDAHDNGEIHFHDKDYFMHRGMFNCCLVNLEDMLANGTVMNGKMVETPKSFQVACTVATQIIASIASNQYGGQSINVKDLSPYLKVSEDKHYNAMLKVLDDKESAKKAAEYLVQKELEAGIQTIQYQINTLMTTNGQSPFVTLFLHLDDNDPYLEYTARIIEEIIRQRIEGIKNEQGVYVTPAFPKLVYVLDENNIDEDSEFYYITEQCAKCTAKRMYPDYISAKIMRESYGDIFAPMGCRSFLSPYEDKNGDLKWYGRFNQGVVTINLPQIGILADKDEDLFFKLLDERLEIAKEALMERHKRLLGSKAKISPIHWQYGGIARLDADDKIDPYLYNGYSTMSLGYIGLNEMSYAVTGEPITGERGKEFSMKVMDVLNEKVDKWKEETNIGFSLYGTPAESLCYRFASIDRERFGVIENVTDNRFYTNSFHVHVGQEIDAFSKLKFESGFQDKSLGGAISYIEIPYMYNNVDALLSIMRYMYENIRYAEFNTKSDFCHECGFEGEIIINENMEWECPNCKNKNKDKMNVVRRTCGYLGENFWNEGKTEEISERVTHL